MSDEPRITPITRSPSSPSRTLSCVRQFRRVLQHRGKGLGDRSLTTSMLPREY